MNGYADNPSVFYTATMMNRQVDALKSSALDLNNSLSNINNALSTANSVATSLQSIKTKLTDMTKAGVNAQQRQNDATDIQSLIQAINGSVYDAINAAGASGKVSLLDSAYNDMTVALGASGTTLTVGAANLSIDSGPPAAGARSTSAISFNAADVTQLLATLKNANATPTVGTPVVTAARAPASGVGRTYTSNTGTSTTTNVLAADTTSATGWSLTSTTTTYGAATAASAFLTAVNNSINAVDNFSKNLGGATTAINNVLSNNTALQSSLTKEVSSLVDADVAAEQVQLSALTVQQQLSVSALTSISQSRQTLLGLFR